MSPFLRRLSSAWIGLQILVLNTSTALAQGGVLGPLPGIPGANPNIGVRTTIVNVLKYVLNFLALLAVIFIVVAGIRLIVSQGEEEQKTKARKTIVYVIIGLIIVLFARLIVEFVTSSTQRGFTGLPE